MLPELMEWIEQACRMSTVAYVSKQSLIFQMLDTAQDSLVSMDLGLTKICDRYQVNNSPNKIIPKQNRSARPPFETPAAVLSNYARHRARSNTSL